MQANLELPNYLATYFLPDTLKLRLACSSSRSTLIKLFVGVLHKDVYCFNDGTHGRLTTIELLLADNHNNGPTALANADYFVQEQVDLVVEFNTDIGYNNVIMEHLQSTHIPVIAIDIPMPGATFVGVDNYRAGLMAGRLVGTYASQLWKGRIDKVLSLGLPSSGPVPAARMQGQNDDLRETLAILDTHILHPDSKNTYEESHKVINTILPIITSAQHIVILGINDEFTLGTLAAFADAGASEQVITIGQGTDQSEETKQRLDPSKLAEEMISVREYDTIPFSRSERNPSHRSLKTR
jgi:ribose transport system substrate-binding protein